MMTKQGFINKVLFAMNEANAQEGIFIGADSSQIEQYIVGSYLETWRRLAKVAPRMWLGNKSFKPEAPSQPTVMFLSEGTGCIVLPEDFYLLTKFKMSGWKIASMVAEVSDSKIAIRQNNEYTRGSFIRPVTVIENKEIEGVVKPVLEYYSLPKGLSTHVVEEAIYVPIIKDIAELLPTETIDLSSQLMEPMVYLCAATVFTIFEKTTIAQSLEAMVTEMIPGFISLKGTESTVKQ